MRSRTKVEIHPRKRKGTSIVGKENWWAREHWLSWSLARVATGVLGIAL